MESKIKFVGDFSRVSEEEKGFINERLEKFREKHENDFSEMHIKLDCQLEKEKSRGRTAHLCKISISTDHGLFNAEDKEFSAEKAIFACLNKVEKQITKKLL